MWMTGAFLPAVDLAKQHSASFRASTARHTEAAHHLNIHPVHDAMIKLNDHGSARRGPSQEWIHRFGGHCPIMVT